MGVDRFRDISDVPPVPPPSEDPAENLRSAFALSEMALRLDPTPPLRGIRKYRSIEEADRARDHPIED